MYHGWKCRVRASFQLASTDYVYVSLPKWIHLKTCLEMVIDRNVRELDRQGSNKICETVCLHVISGYINIFPTSIHPDWFTNHES